MKEFSLEEEIAIYNINSENKSKIDITITPSNQKNNVINVNYKNHNITIVNYRPNILVAYLRLIRFNNINLNELIKDIDKYLSKNICKNIA
jgi:hypothetical protein